MLAYKYAVKWPVMPRSVNAAVAAVQLLLGICFFTLQRKKVPVYKAGTKVM